MPGLGITKKWNVLILSVGFSVSLLMSWLSPIIIIALLYIIYTIIGKLSNMESWLTGFRGIIQETDILTFSLYILGSVFFLHFVANVALKYNVGVSRRFNQLEAVFAGFGLLWLVVFMITGLTVDESLGQYSYWYYRGMYSNKMLSIIMTVINARLGFWVANPLKKMTTGLVWWPTYFFYELFSLIGTDNRKLNISDGGHIENLGVYELLRRKCRLIIFNCGKRSNLKMKTENQSLVRMVKNLRFC